MTAEELTTDLMEISFFAEVAWLKLGDVGSQGRRTRLRSSCRHREGG